MRFFNSILPISLLTCAAHASPLRLKRQTSAQAFASSADSSLQLSAIAPPTLSSTGPAADECWVLNITDTQAGFKQVVHGFGGSVTDATVTVINSLPVAQRSQLLSELMTPAGANFAFLRHTIAASDLSGAPAYTFDDSNNQINLDLSNFNLGGRGVAMAQMLAEMKALNPSTTILGSSWSPPGWMKESGVSSNQVPLKLSSGLTSTQQLTGTTDGNSLSDTSYTAFANYFVSYLKAFQTYGVNIDAITIQNEPLNSQSSGDITMLMEPSQAATVTQSYVGPALQAAGLTTSIWAYDHNTDRPDYPQTVMETASEYVSATAWHCYANPPNWSVITDFHNQYPSKGNHMTECWTSPSTSWNQASANTMGPLQNWAETSGMWTLGTWTEQSDGTFGPYIPGGCATCSGLFLVDEQAGTYSFTIDYYMLAQYSKFIPVGAVVVQGTGSYTYEDGTGVQSVATMNPDGSRTVVIESTLEDDMTISLNTASGENWSGMVPARSVVTWVLP